MKKEFLLLFLILIVYCEDSASSTVSFSACDETNRPDACDASYSPVCGFGGSSPETFSNGCTACST